MNMKYTIADNNDMMLYDDRQNLIVFDTKEEAEAELAELDVPHEKFRVIGVE